MTTRQYEIEVRTGNHENAGTDAHVFIQLIGAKGKSGEDILDNPNVNDFKKGHTDTFKITDEDVGWIDKVRLFHDNKKDHPGWYVDYVKVKYPDVGLELKADYYRWLAKSEGDGKIDVTQDVACSAPSYSGGFLEHTYLDYEPKRKSNGGPGVMHYADEFTYNYTQGLGLQLNRSVSASTHASLSASFFGIGSSFEGTVTKAACQQWSTTAQETFTSKTSYSMDLDVGQAVTVIAMYYQDVFTANALAAGIEVPFEQKFAVTADLLSFPGILTDAQIAQKVVDMLGYISGAPSQPQAAHKALRFGRKAVMDLTPANIARMREDARLKFLSPARLASVPGAKTLPTKLQLIKHR